ncbi:hypothetical protein ACUXST_001723 [Sphingomonas sp. F9_3S_D5_B_2]
MSRRVVLPLVAALLFATSCTFNVLNGPEGFWDWLGVAVFGSGAFVFGWQSLKTLRSEM